MKWDSILRLSTVLLFVLSGISVASKKLDPYCFDYYDKYREIKYWAKRHISVSDYEYDSGDAKYLNLCSEDPNSRVNKITNKEIVSYFNSEFKRLFTKKLPFYDTEKGEDERWNEIYQEHGGKNNFLEIWRASEEARRNALYGTNPGAIFCIIKISRREFPVLYEMKSSVVARNDLWNRGGLEIKKLGYSSPEHIINELKHSITEHLEELHRKLEKIKDCDN